MSGGQKCEDCPNRTERRQADITFRETIIAQISGLSANFKTMNSGIDKIEESVWDAMNETRSDIKKLYFRMGIISGSSGAIGGIIAAIIINAMKGR